MEVFRADGHLSEEALKALAGNQGVFSQLERLEAAEHLAFCDECLQRYTELLTAESLLTPERSCQKRLWVRIRTRTLQALTSRYATAAAAVALSLTILWGGERVEFVRPSPAEEHVSVSRQLTGLTEDLGDSLQQAVTRWSDFFDGLRPGEFIQGGNNA